MGLLVLGVHALFSQGPGRSFVSDGVFLLCVSATLALTATAYLRAKRLFVPLGLVVGAAFLLYAAAVISIGNEDVGGPSTAVPLSGATAAYGIWLVIAAIVEPSQW